MASDRLQEPRTSLKAEMDRDYHERLRDFRARLQEETDRQFPAVPAIVRKPINCIDVADEKAAAPLKAASRHTGLVAKGRDLILTWFGSWIRTVFTGGVVGALIGVACR
jgi:hypothetical protein